MAHVNWLTTHDTLRKTYHIWHTTHDIGHTTLRTFDTFNLSIVSLQDEITNIKKLLSIFGNNSNYSESLSSHKKGVTHVNWHMTHYVKHTTHSIRDTTLRTCDWFHMIFVSLQGKIAEKKTFCCPIFAIFRRVLVYTGMEQLLQKYKFFGKKNNIATDLYLYWQLALLFIGCTL